MASARCFSKWRVRLSLRSKFEESKKYHMKHISLKPDDPDPYYWVGVVDWTLAYRANAEMRQRYNSENPKKQIKGRRSAARQASRAISPSNRACWSTKA